MNSPQLLNCQSEADASAWFGSSVGQYLLAKEQALFDHAVADVFGFNALQMGCPPLDLLQNSRIPNRFIASELPDIKNKQHVYCCDDYLPFAEQSLDLLLLPHKLEFSAQPHQTLREAERVLVHEGHLMISGFNPLSSWGLTSGLKKFFSNHNAYPWHGKFIGLARIKDWLALLGFEVVSVEMSCCMLPFEKMVYCRHLAFMDQIDVSMLGGVYFIVAKKRVVGMTPLKPQWSNTLMPSRLVARPTPSSIQQKADLAPVDGVQQTLATKRKQSKNIQ